MAQLINSGVPPEEIESIIRAAGVSPYPYRHRSPLTAHLSPFTPTLTLTPSPKQVTHQSEEIFIKDTLRKYDFCEAQFRSTRDAMCSNWASDMLWGGMQWQLEHHLFPTMPRYKYKALHPVLRQWSQEHGLDFRTSGELEILVQNIAQLKKIGNQDAVEGNPDSTPLFKQV